MVVSSKYINKWSVMGFLLLKYMNTNKVGYWIEIFKVKKYLPNDDGTGRRVSEVATALLYETQ